MIIYIIAVISIILILWFQEPLFCKNTDKADIYVNIFHRMKLPLIILCIIILVFTLYCSNESTNYEIYNSIPNF